MCSLVAGCWLLVAGGWFVVGQFLFSDGVGAVDDQQCPQETKVLWYSAKTIDGYYF